MIRPIVDNQLNPMVNPLTEQTPPRSGLQVDADLQERGNQVLTDKLCKRMLWALFLLLYVPILYHRGWLLPPDIGIDFPTYLQGARVTFVEGRTPFGLHAFDGIPGFTGGKVQPYVYPPPSLLAFWPLAKLSIANAGAAFLVVSHLSCLGCIWLILFRLTPLPGDPRRRSLVLAVALIYMLSVNALPDTFGNGQVNFIALLFICLALAAYRQRSSEWLIAAPLSIAILLKTYPVFLLALLFFRKRYRAVMLTCALFIAFTALAFVVLPRSVWHSWFVEVVPLGAYANNSFPAAFCWNQSINAFVMRLFQENYFSRAPLYYPALAKPVATGLALLVMGVTLFYSYRATKASNLENGRDEEIAAFLLMTYLVAPLSWDHHLVYIFPAAVLSISLLISGNVRKTAAVAIAGSLLLIAWRFPIDRLDIVTGWWTLLMSAKLYPVVFLWLFFIQKLRLSRNNPASIPAISRSNSSLDSAEANLA